MRHGVLRREQTAAQRRNKRRKTKTMKKTLILQVAVAGVLALAVSAQAGSPKADQWAENHQTVVRTTPDPDLVHQVALQNGTPHTKVDLYVAQPSNAGTEHNFLADLRNQNGSPHAKTDVYAAFAASTETDRAIQVAPLKAK